MLCRQVDTLTQRVDNLPSEEDWALMEEAMAAILDEAATRQEQEEQAADAAAAAAQDHSHDASSAAETGQASCAESRGQSFHSFALALQTLCFGGSSRCVLHDLQIIPDVMRELLVSCKALYICIFIHQQRQSTEHSLHAIHDIQKSSKVVLLLAVKQDDHSLEEGPVTPVEEQSACDMLAVAIKEEADGQLSGRALSLHS